MSCDSTGKFKCVIAFAPLCLKIRRFGRGRMQFLRIRAGAEPAAGAPMGPCRGQNGHVDPARKLPKGTQPARLIGKSMWTEWVRAGVRSFFLQKMSPGSTGAPWKFSRND